MNTLCAESVRAALAQMRPRPSVEMYPGDWLRDPISGCSLAANGFWWRATITMHDAKPYGHMVGNNGRPLTDQQIAQKCGARSTAELKKVLREIEDAGIPGRTGDSDYADILKSPEIDIRGVKWTLDLSPLGIQESGVIYSRRMVRDRILSLVRFLVTPRGQSFFPSLQEGLCAGLQDGLRTQIPAFDRTRARDAQEDEDRSSSTGESGSELGEGSGERNPAPKPLTPQQQAVGIVLDAFAVELRPHPGLAARWIDQIAEGRNDPDPIAAAEAVREIVWKYPDKSPDYIGKCVGTAAARIRSGEDHVIGRRPPGRKIINFA